MIQSVFKKQLFISVVLLTLSFSLRAKDYPFKGKNWTIINVENNQEAEKQLVIQDGLEVLKLPRGHIALLNENYADFKFEFDIKGGRMPGTGFRSVNLWDYEYFYLRIGASGKETAIQYIPVFNGATAWEIYNYPKYESSAEFKDDDWIHITIDVFKDNMRVYVNNNSSPNMELKLKHTDLNKGNIFLESGFKDSFFRNVKLSELKESFNVNVSGNPNQYIDHWKLSEQFDVNFNSQGEIYSKYNEQLKKEKWEEITADNDGIVNISKYYKHPGKTIIAISEIYSDSDKKVDLLFDYTFSMLIGLNRDILFCGTELDTKNYMRVIDGEEKISLSLKKGKNELIFMIKSDDIWQEAVGNSPYLGRKQAANWGFIARLSDYTGISLENTDK